MNIEFLDPKSLKPHPQNSRTHSDEQIQQLMASITEFGFNGTIIIDEDDVILAGHGRTQAMIRLGRETIPCLRKEGLTDLEKRAYVIADNAIGQNSEWNEGVLAAEVAMLVGQGFDLSTFGIPLGALEELNEPPPETAKAVRKREPKADAGPASAEAFEQEMARQGAPVVLPIVPEHGERHAAFIVVCATDDEVAWARDRFGLASPLPDAGGRKRRSFVVAAAELRERLQ